MEISFFTWWTWGASKPELDGVSIRLALITLEVQELNLQPASRRASSFIVYFFLGSESRCSSFFCIFLVAGSAVNYGGCTNRNSPYSSHLIRVNYRFVLTVIHFTPHTS